LRPELQALFERLAVDPHSELFTRHDGMLQSGPDPVSVTAPVTLRPRAVVPLDPNTRCCSTPVAAGCIVADTSNGSTVNEERALFDSHPYARRRQRP
jgi:hypothetical protein